ncbi:MAG TPA: helix-turn-helix domain-containing protein [Chloroflexia bacterium]|nr:helix-turn-helix domain-containing protein [Chloroflexia bacterium]
MAARADPIQAQLTAARRAQILDAATRVFAAKGFHRATIRDVAQAAGVADGTIYNYFGNKTDVLLGLLNRLSAVEERPTDFAAAHGMRWDAFLRLYLAQRLSALQADSAAFRAVLPELLADATIRERYLAQGLAPAMAVGEAYMAHLVAAGQIRPVDTALLARIMAGTVLGLLLLQLLGDPYLPAHTDAIPAALADLFIQGLAPPQGEGAFDGRDPIAEPGQPAV